MSKDDKVTVAQVLFPVSLIGFVLFLFLAFQTSQLLNERESLHQARAQQDKPLEDAQKVGAQLNALAVGTLKLSQAGNKDAQGIIDRMKQLGITVTPPSTTGTTPEVPANTP